MNSQSSHSSNTLPGSTADDLLMPSIVNMNLEYVPTVFHGYCMKTGILDSVKRLAGNKDKSLFPLSICGQKGTARTTAAHIIYNEMGFKEKKIPAYRIDGPVITKKVFEKALSIPDSPFKQHEKIFLYLFDLDYMDKEVQKLIVHYLNQLERSSCYVIASMREKPSKAVEAGKLEPELACWLGSRYLSFPPLCKRKDLIEFLVKHLIHNYNAEFQKHILDLEPAALELLVKYDWPGNITQLNQVMSLLVIGTSGSYITESLVRYQLQTESYSGRVHADYLKLDSTKTLSEMTYDIIEYILYQENWNQSSAAKRLNISRSTLWRILNSNHPSKKGD